ncbi:MAG: glycogen synthase GlgA [Calditrichaeota bacterium]|nr:glycogen synthase GlgA [Calditrichota bacterium]
MKNRLRILFLSSEVAPFTKTGGLADVSSALPKALFDMGHDVRVLTPKYGSISDRKYILREVIRLKKIPIQMGGKEHITSAKSAFIPDAKVQIYFLEYKPFFGHQDLYVDSQTGKDFPNNAERFMLFSRAVLETIKLLVWQPQIIHCNDWQTAMIPYLLKNEFKDDPFFAKTATVLSIHNLAFQGSFDPKVTTKLGLPEEAAKPGSDLEIYEKINFLKAGILNANIITTVSPTYADEIQDDPELGAGLGEILRQRRQDIYGILNGVDQTVWNPEKDSYLENKYDSTNLDGKIENKKILLKKSKLPFDESVPVIGIISRLTDQKGFDLIAEAIDKIIKLNVQLVVLGMGDSKYQKLFKDISKKHPQNVAVFLRFDEELAHLIEAGSDIFLMPSRYEPCGLNQMYSLKYGTVPVVRKTGGLADTIVDFIEDPNKGNGFSFEAYESGAMLQAIKKAVDTFKDQKTWQKLIKRGMRQDFSWHVAADKYVKLYSKLESNKRKK